MIGILSILEKVYDIPLDEVVRKLPIFVEKGIANALSSGCGASILSYLQVVRNWSLCVPPRNRHLHVLLRALLTFYRQKRAGILGGVRG